MPKQLPKIPSRKDLSKLDGLMCGTGRHGFLPETANYEIDTIKMKKKIKHLAILKPKSVDEMNDFLEEIKEKRVQKPVASLVCKAIIRLTKIN